MEPTKIAFIVVFLLAMAIFVIGYFHGERAMKRRKMARFHDRPDLSFDDFYTKFYRDSGISRELIQNSLQAVSSATEIPKEKLRPDDRFDRELAPSKGWEFDDGIAEVFWLIEEEMKRAGRTYSPKIETVGDLIRFLHETRKHAS